MSAMSDYLENMLIDGLFRGGALTAAGAAGSTAVVNKGIWIASTAYSLGDLVVPISTMTAAGGKFLRCTTAGTSGSTATLAVPNPGSTLTDGTVTWTAVSGVPAPLALYFGLLTATPSDTGGGTEVSGGSYARQPVTCSLANFAGTQAAASTTASTGTNGTTSNNAAITFSPAPTAAWGSIGWFGVYDQLTGGNLLWWGALTTAKTVNSGDAAPSFAISAFALQIDN